MTTAIRDYDQKRADAFAEKMLGILNGGAVSLMTSVGHRTGLFDVLAELPPATSPEIAEQAGLQERYVREWLGSMVAAEIVEYDPQSKKYSLPREHAAWLTRSSVPNNMAGVAQWVPLLGQVEDLIVEAFSHGGGVPYEKFHRFHHVMAEESGQTSVWAVLDHILPLVPDMKDKLATGINVLDVGCGAGRVLCLLAQAFPGSRFTGIDLCDDAVAAAETQAREQGSTNVHFKKLDARQLGSLGKFDLITAFDAIHDQADPAGVLRAIFAALKPGGTFLMQDIGASTHVERNREHPLGPFIYTVSCMHCMTVSLSQGGAGLGAAWGEELAQEMLREAGFSRVSLHKLPHDMMNTYYVVVP
jgi:2-polyprenyl-3-methyl-5-hydroxy-6-metoxy-1,4-benzoquinol methylase